MRTPPTNPMGMSRRSGRQDGYAMPMVIFLGLVLVMLAALVIERSINQTGTEATDARYEQAFNAAEGGADVFLVDFRTNPDFTNHSGVIADKNEAIDAARAIAAADPSQIIDTPEGQAVVVSPDGEATYYAVGFMPSVDDSRARVRVIQTSYGTEPSLIPWVPNIALLFNEDAEVPGQVVLKGSHGSAHTNGDLDVPKGQIKADSCVTSSGDIKSGKNKISVGSGCLEGDDAEGLEPIEIPDVAARDLWIHTEYQLCPDGSVRPGPAHVTSGTFAQSEPCDANAPVLGKNNYRGWKYDGIDEDAGAVWTYSNNQPKNGAYYIFHGSASITSSPAKWQVSLVTEAEGEVCDKVGGDISITGNIGSLLYGGASPVAFFADRDMEVAGNKNTVGHMIAREQLLMTGNPAVEGSFTTGGDEDEDGNACDSEDSPVSSNLIDGNPVITYDADDFDGTGWLVPEGPPVVIDINRDEL